MKSPGREENSMPNPFALIFGVRRIYQGIERGPFQGLMAGKNDKTHEIKLPTISREAGLVGWHRH